MNTPTAGVVIKVFREVFARTGIPFVVVTDNGPQFCAEELAQFMKSNGVKHILTPTYHPKSNGLAERLVGSFKSAMKKMWTTSKNVDKNLTNFLLMYRNTPHSVTGQRPAMMMYNRTLCSKLHQISPTDKQKKDNLQIEKQQKITTSRAQRSFCVNQPVRVQISDDKTWKLATIIRRAEGDSNVYEILHEGRIIKKNADHILGRLQPLINLAAGKEGKEGKQSVCVSAESVASLSDFVFSDERAQPEAVGQQVALNEQTAASER